MNMFRNAMFAMAVVATTGAVSAVSSGDAMARDLAKEWQQGYGELGRSISDIESDFRTGFNPVAPRSVSEILSGTNLEAPAKPDSFRGVDLESN